MKGFRCIVVALAFACAPLLFARVTVTPLSDDTETNAPAEPPAEPTAPVELTETNAPSASPEPVATPAPVAPAIGFGTIAKTDRAYTAALDAHDLKGTLQLVGKRGAFKGTVSGLYEPGTLKILNFDPKFSRAVSAVLKPENASKFPDVRTLVGKQVVVTGTFIDFRGRAEIILFSPDQIKLVK